MRDLTEHLADLDAAWGQADARQRVACRDAYRRDGWKLCEHDTCRPWNCVDD